MHPWIWLNEPQHSAAVQAVVAVLFGLPTLAFLVIGAIAAWRLAHASRRQAYAADEQAKVARAQTTLIAAQLKEQIRPILVLERAFDDTPWVATTQVLYLRNVGSGGAANVRSWFEYLRVDGTQHERDRNRFNGPSSIPPTQASSVPRLRHLQSDGVLKRIEVLYEAVDGTPYTRGQFFKH